MSDLDFWTSFLDLSWIEVIVVAGSIIAVLIILYEWN
jgi:uncharacterized membrane-anchored protein